MNAFYGEDKASLPVVSQPLEDSRAPTLMGEDGELNKESMV